MIKQYKNPVQLSVRDCTKCALHGVYDGPVPISLGQPGFLFIAEAPGHEEDEIGIPLSGPSGRFLRMRAKTAGIAPARSSFCNVVSCRPHDNRDPSNYELMRCRNNLIAQINVAQPRVIITLGKFALTALYPHGVLKNDVGKVLYWGKLSGHSTWIVPTWHPAYINRSGGRGYEDTWLNHLRYAASLISGRPEFPETCRVCGGPVEQYDVMAGAWCKYHYREVPRVIWQDEMFDDQSLYDASNTTGKKVSKQKARARKMGLL